MKSESVGIGNEDFFVANVIGDCPVRTVIREHLQNAIEASGPVGGLVQWFKQDFDGVPKLGLYNSGVGMDRDELRERLKVASTGKKLGADENFGMGAKMSGAAASPHGVIWTTCKDGRVFQSQLRFEDGPAGGKRLVLVTVADPSTGEIDNIIDVTHRFAPADLVKNGDWFRVVFMGRSAEDDTTKGDWVGLPHNNWLMQAINQRYYEFPGLMTVRNVMVTLPGEKSETRRSAGGLAHALAPPSITERQEIVEADHPQLGPVKILFGKLKLAKGDRRGGLLYANGVAPGTHVCLVWRRENYAFNPKWFHGAGPYGFSQAAEDYYVHVILPDDAPVKNDNHRENLIFRDGSATIVDCVHFADIIKASRPQWIVDDVASRNSGCDLTEVHERLRALANKFAAKLKGPVILPGPGRDQGVSDVDRPGGPSGNGGGASGEGPASVPRGKPASGTGAPSQRRRADVGDINFCKKDDNPGWYEDHGGFAGVYDGANEVLLSTDFQRFRELQEWVDREWGHDPEENQIASTILRNEYIYHAGAFILGAISFKGAQPQGWTPNQWKEAITKESLSAHMMGLDGVIESAVKQKAGNQINPNVAKKARGLNRAG